MGAEHPVRAPPGDHDPLAPAYGALQGRGHARAGRDLQLVVEAVFLDSLLGQPRQPGAGVDAGDGALQLLLHLGLCQIGDGLDLVLRDIGRHHPAQAGVGVEQPQIEALGADLLQIVLVGPGLPGHQHHVDVAGGDALVLRGDIGLQELDLLIHALLEDARGELGDELGVGPGGPADLDAVLGGQVGHWPKGQAQGEGRGGDDARNAACRHGAFPLTFGWRVFGGVGARCLSPSNAQCPVGGRARSSG